MLSQQLKAYAAEHYEARKPYFTALSEDLEKVLAECTEDERTLMQFFYGTMPLRDAGEYDSAVFLGYVRHALWLRENVAWCKELPEDIFVQHVLYYRINSEDITDCRAFFYGQLARRIEGLSLMEAVIEINYWCAEHATYQSTDIRTASPMTLYRCGKGRCGEESTFAVTAYRSVGIPARQVYTPKWAHCDDNHAWVEVYVEGEWHFLGACEPEEVLNRGWFAGPAGRALLIHTRTFSDYGKEDGEEYIGREHGVHFFNRTSYYTKTRSFTVTVKDGDGSPVSGASVAFEILNMASYSPAATLFTDEAGQARITLGLGDIQLCAKKGEAAAWKKVSTKQDAVLTLEKGALTAGGRTEGLWEAPVECLLHPGRQTSEQKKRNEERVKEAARLREERLAACFHAEYAREYPQEEEMFRIAGANITELYRFLDRDNNPDRRLMLHHLAVKDYKDLRADVLEDHLNCERGELPEEIYAEYLLNPRILMEELTPWRGYIRKYFTQEEKEAFLADPNRIWDYIGRNIDYSPQEDYDTICATPIGCLKMKQGNLRAKMILFVAICRSLGIPARISRRNFRPEYYSQGGFLIPDGFAQNGKEERKEAPAVLKIQVHEGSKWNYFQDWTIARWEGGTFRPLFFREFDPLENTAVLNLESGIYRLVTVQRIPNGNQYLAVEVLHLKSGESRTVLLERHALDVSDMLVHYELEDCTLTDSRGESVRLSALSAGERRLFAFLGVGGEPTEHVLNEFLESAGEWNAMEKEPVFVLRGEEDLANPTMQKVLKAVERIRIFYAPEECAASAAERMHVSTELLPVMLVTGGGLTGCYACAGYNVGSVGLIRRILEI